jgi:hypothetical protein
VSLRAKKNCSMLWIWPTFLSDSGKYLVTRHGALRTRPRGTRPGLPGVRWRTRRYDIVPGHRWVSGDDDLELGVGAIGCGSMTITDDKRRSDDSGPWSDT